MQRRDVLRAAGIGSLAGLAGCTGLLVGDGDDSAQTADGDTPTGGDSSGTALRDHPAGAAIGDQPRKGGLDGHVVVVFEDPSCPTCKAFEAETVPKIESNLVDTGAAALVVRGYPVVYPWGEPATQALEATYDRDEGAFWALLDHYFDRQSTFDSDNVLDRTEQFLDSETSVDGAAVLTDVGNDAYADAVQTDLDAGQDAGATATPTVFLFRDGNYLTEASGNVSYDLIATALGE